jgi:hypothetical protein
MWRLAYRPEVEDDVVAAIRWYDEKRTGLGHDFLAEYLAAIRRIRENPLQFARAANGLRPCRLKRFSYIVHFDVLGHEILVIAVMAGGRDESAFLHRSE